MSYLLTKRFFATARDFGLRQRQFVVYSKLQTTPPELHVQVLQQAMKQFTYGEALDLFVQARPFLSSLTLSDCIRYYDSFPFPAKRLTKKVCRMQDKEAEMFWRSLSDLILTSDDLMQILYRIGPDHRLAFVIDHAHLFKTPEAVERCFDKMFVTLQAYELDGPRSSLVKNDEASRLAFENATKHVYESSYLTASKQ